MCGGQLPTNMSAPLGPPDANVTSYLCSWRLDAPRGPTEQALAQPATKTLAVVIKLSGIYRFRTPCHKYTTRVLLQKAGGYIVAECQWAPGCRANPRPSASLGAGYRRRLGQRLARTGVPLFVLVTAAQTGPDTC